MNALNAAEQAAVADAAGRAAKRFDWYAEILRERGFFEQPVSDRVPILRESDLATTYYVDEDSPTERVYVTSGTATGRRKRVRWTVRDHERYVGHRAELFRATVDDGNRTAVADLGTGHAAASAIEIFRRAGLQGREIDFAWPIERHLDLLRQWRADVIYTMPMILERIVAAGGPGYDPKWIFVLGDLAPPRWRAAIAERLGMPNNHVVDLFGSIETGAIAYSDHRVGANVFHDHIVPETVAPTESSEPGAQALVLTSLERDGFPQIRYVAGDLVTGLRREVVAGRDRWVYDRHLGREGTEIKHGEMLSLYSIADAIGAAAPGVAWGVRREGLEVVIELDERGYSASIANTVRRAVRAAHPAVDTMINSGLVGDIGVEPRAFPDGTHKRAIMTAGDDSP